jgi:glycosyltransferase involved in cell wall biosynthesis
METNPFFSIIIPAYNRAYTIARTIQSCLNQSFTNFEIIVINDGSTDNTNEILKNFNDERLKYIEQPNSERSAARNHGIKIAKGEYVTFLDSDDTIHTDLLKHVKKMLNVYGQPFFYNQAYRIVNQENEILQNASYFNDDLYILVKGNALSCIGNFLNRKITNEYLFNENREIIRSEDWELWIRIASRYGYKSDNTILCNVLDHSERSVRNFNIEKLIVHRYAAIESAMRDNFVKEKLGKYTNRIYAYCDTYIALHLILRGHKKKGWGFLIQGIKKYPGFIFKKRFFAIMKHLIFK